MATDRQTDGHTSSLLKALFMLCGAGA